MSGNSVPSLDIENPPKVSVVVPIYGTQRFLRKCLDSILEQTFQAIEVICVDDKSPDESAAIVEEYILRDKRVSLIRHQVNLGLGGARNTGIAQASAEYIMGVDSDDFVNPSLIEDLYRCALEEDCDIVECGYAEVSEGGKVLREYTPNRSPLDLTENTNFFGVTRYAFWNKLYRRSLFTDGDIWFPEHVYYEDLATIPRLLSRSKRLGYVGAIRYSYVQRGDSITNLIKEKNILDYIKVFDLLSEDMRSIGIFESQKEYFNNAISINFDFVMKKIALTDDPYKINLIRYAQYLERSFRENVGMDGQAYRVALRHPPRVEETLPASPLPDSTSKTARIAVISRYDDDEAVMRLKIGAFRKFISGKASFSKYSNDDKDVDGILINHLDSLDGLVEDIREFRQRKPDAPVIALVSDLYFRVGHQMKTLHDVVDAFIVPTVEMKSSMACFTDQEIHVLEDPVDFLLETAVKKIHFEKKPLDLLWFGYSESFQKSMPEFSPLLEYLHSVRAIRYHIFTNAAGFNSPEHALVHDYKPNTFVNLLPMFDLCVLSHVPNDFQIATYFKSENKAVLAINQGVPVIASRTPSYERLLRKIGQEELLFSNRDELERAISALSTAQARNAYLSESQDFVQKHFSPRIIALKWWDIFCTLRGKKRKSHTSFTPPH